MSEEQFRDEIDTLKMNDAMALKRFKHFCSTVCVAEWTSFLLRMLCMIGAEHITEFITTCYLRGENLSTIFSELQVLDHDMETLMKHDVDMTKQMVNKYLKVYPGHINVLNKALSLGLLDVSELINREAPLKSKIFVFLRNASYHSSNKFWFSILAKLQMDEAFSCIRDDVFVLFMNKVDLRYCNEDDYAIVINMLESGAFCSSIIMRRILEGFSPTSLKLLFKRVPASLVNAKDVFLTMSVMAGQFNVPFPNIGVVLSLCPEWINLIHIEKRDIYDDFKPLLCHRFLLDILREQPALWKAFEHHASESTLEVLNMVKSDVQ